MTRLKAALDEHAIVSIANVHGKITYVNDKFCEISGYDRLELLGRKHGLLKSGLHPAAFYEDMWNDLVNGKIWHGEVCNRRKDGSFYWVNGTIVPFSGEDGLPYQYVSIRTEITAIKKAEAALRVSEERLSRSQTYANIGTWDWNIQTGTVFWSERIGPLFGYDNLVETSYENFLSAVHPDDRQKVIDAVAACVERGEKYDIEHRVVWPDGSLRWVLERGDVTRNKNGSPTHMLGVVQDITERRLAGHKRQASEASLANAQRIAHLGNWDYDLVSGQIVWSDEVYRIFGLEPGGISPDIQSYYHWTHPDDRARLRNGEEKTIREGRGEILHRIVRPDGSIRHVHLIGEVVADAAGQPLRMTGTVHDITAIKLAEESVRQSEALLRQFYELSPLGIAQNDMDGYYLQVNRAMLDMTGYQEKELLALSCRDITPHEEYEVTDQRQRDALITTGRYGPYEKEYIHRDGHRVPVVHNGVKVTDTEGREIVWSIVQDISERRQVEQQVRDIGERFRNLVETTADWIWEVNADVCYTYASPRVRDLLGYQPEEVLGKSLFDLMPPEEIERLASEFGHIVENRQPFSGLINQNYHKDGSIVVLESSGVPIYNVNGEFAGYRGIDRDVSERFEREASLRAAKEVAEQANQAKSIFLSSMSHELRTPMNAILGFAQLLKMQNSMTEDQGENVEEILKAGRHLLALINEVLDLSKIEAGHLDLFLEQVSCCEITRESLNLVRSIAERHGIQLLEENVMHCPVMFQTDRTRMRQIVINLLTNAIKYNRPGGTVTLRLVPGQDGCARIVVTDTGLGLTPEQQSELFQPFQRLNAAQSGIEGNGIGLAISKQLIEAMGGRIGVDSMLGVGSTFWVELPCMETPADMAWTSMATGFGGKDIPEASASEPRATILYIEDNPANARLMEQIIALQPSWKLVCVHTPELGLEWALGNIPDLILLDINLPGMNGFQVLKRLQAMPTIASIPVMAVTANAMPRDIERGLAAGFREYLTKPLDLSRFMSCLVATLRGPIESDSL
ncbi:MAG: PAS domain S-box protein [Sulfuricellaceae bacterium]|nr:PAS domain S-box protein [Sulfuricellaceae bacterium]